MKRTLVIAIFGVLVVSHYSQDWTYIQTAEYGAHNYNDSLDAFVTDLYHAFLQREPDAAGHCFWVNETCAEGGRKHVILPFIVSIEFGRLIDGLNVGSAPSCSLGGDDGGGHGGDCGPNRDWCLENFGAFPPPW